MPETMAPPMPGAGAGAPPPMPGGPPPAGGPPGPTAPATVAPDSGGLKMRGKVQISMGLKFLTQALGLVGVETPEGQVLAKALATLGKTFGEASPDLSQQEVKLAGQRVAPVQQPTPQQGAAFQQMIKSKLGGMGMGGAQPASPAA